MEILVIGFLIMLASTIGIARNVKYFRKCSLMHEGLSYFFYLVIIFLWFFAIFGYTEAIKGPTLDPLMATTMFSTIFLAGIFVVTFLVRHIR